jgi:hypothetical protein
LDLFWKQVFFKLTNCGINTTLSCGLNSVSLFCYCHKIGRKTGLKIGHKIGCKIGCEVSHKICCKVGHKIGRMIDRMECHKIGRKIRSKIGL